MTAIDQEKQTLHYFDTHAGDWQATAVGKLDRYNVIAARNAAVVRVLEAMSGVSRFLDVGCGTGQLVIEVAEKGIKADGIDFAPDMIRQCEANRQRAGVEAEFSCLSFFDMPAEDGRYDAISALGFIEYISPQETDVFLSRCFSMLGEGGALVVGSRNRLFNLLSLNDYTLTELRLGTVELLTAEAVALHQSESLQEAVEALRPHERVHPQPERHPHTGIDVELRYQYSPAGLIHRARAVGFVPSGIFPVHFHGIPIALKNAHPGMHAELSNLVGRLAPTDFRLVPYCSTFVLALSKGE